MCHRNPIEVKKLRIEAYHLQCKLDERGTVVAGLEYDKAALKATIDRLNERISNLHDDIDKRDDLEAQIQLQDDLDVANDMIEYQRKVVRRILWYEHPQVGLIAELLYHDTLDGREILAAAEGVVEGISA